MEAVLRRKPIQGRAEQTVAAIMRSALKVLETEGIGGFSANVIASQAGVSIGTLYQYFGAKQDLLTATARSVVNPALADIAALLAGRTERDTQSVVAALIGVFDGPRDLRIPLFEALFGKDSGQDWAALGGVMPEESETCPGLPREAVFVLTRGVLGVLRAAIFEEDANYDRERLKLELVRMIEAYVQNARATTS